MLYLFLANGFEETEAVAPLDVIRRAGLDIKTVGVDGNVVLGTHGVRIAADTCEIDYKAMDGIILPGGMPGTLNLHKSELGRSAIEYCDKNNKLIAAICAAPMVIGEMGLLAGKKAVCFPGFEDSLTDAEILSDGVVRDGCYITARGAGKALEFGAEIVNYFTESGKGEKILKKMQI